MSEYGKARALAASLRLPNLPSVLCNVLTGTLIAGFANPAHPAWAMCVATCLYFAGNLLNDWADLEWDRSKRPERALPRKLFHPLAYLATAFILITTALTISILLSAMAFAFTLAITISILLYTWSHKQHAWSVIFMALCRALLPLLGYHAIQHDPGADTPLLNLCVLFAFMLFSYILMLSLRARSESSEPCRKTAMRSSLGFLIPPLLAIVALGVAKGSSDHSPIAILAGLLPFSIWTTLSLTRMRKPVSGQVSALLAGIPLVDAMLLIPWLIWLWLQHLHISHVILMSAWLPLFLAGRLLQRLVPAT